MTLTLITPSLKDYETAPHTGVQGRGGGALGIGTAMVVMGG